MPRPVPNALENSIGFKPESDTPISDIISARRAVYALTPPTAVAYIDAMRACFYSFEIVGGRVVSALKPISLRHKEIAFAFILKRGVLKRPNNVVSFVREFKLFIVADHGRSLK